MLEVDFFIIGYLCMFLCDLETCLMDIIHIWNTIDLFIFGTTPFYIKNFYIILWSSRFLTIEAVVGIEVEFYNITPSLARLWLIHNVIYLIFFGNGF